MACSCNGKCSRCKKRGGRIQKYQSGGYLQGPSHEMGGIPAIVGGTTPVELEGGEYIIRKSSVDKYGEGTIARINQGLVDAGKLQQLKKGGRVTKKHMGGTIMRRKSRTARPVRKKMVRGGNVSRVSGRKPKRMAKGGNVRTIHRRGGSVMNRNRGRSRRYQHGGIINHGLGTNGQAMNSARSEVGTGNNNQTQGGGTNLFNNMIAGRLGMDGYGMRKGGRVKRMGRGGRTRRLRRR
tara:strand:- start:659 stop:1369 length:711 start_codon:yes stop_codon:yes gene_type:complete